MSVKKGLNPFKTLKETGLYVHTEYGSRMKKIKPEALVPLDLFAKEGLLRVDLAYARDDNLLFREAVYRKGARLWLHETLAEIVTGAAQALKSQGLRLIVHDGLRTVDAQKKMTETKRVKENPHWLREPRLLSPPGSGGHPRGMAVDVSVETHAGEILDMGTAFDFLAGNATAEFNPAHRMHPKLSETVRANRKILDDAMMGAAKLLDTPLLPLPQEWWDFRLMPEFYEAYAPLSDRDLPPEMRMILF